MAAGTVVLSKLACLGTIAADRIAKETTARPWHLFLQKLYCV